MYEENKWFVRINDYYKKGYYTEEQVKIFVSKYITQEECNEIILK